MQALKKTFLFLIFIGGLIFLFSPVVLPIDFNVQDVLNIAGDSDVIIVFTPGGWGDTPFEKADDFAPVIEGIKDTLDGLGYKSIVVPYNRTKSNFLGKLISTKDFFDSFKSSSEVLAGDLEELSQKMPDKKIIVAGLSNGAAIINKAYERISEDSKKSIYGIVAGSPFWIEASKSENILQLDNNNDDTLADGEVMPLIIALVKTPYIWIKSKFSETVIPFTKAFKAEGHSYSWSSLEVNYQIVAFLEERIR